MFLSFLAASFAPFKASSASSAPPTKSSMPLLAPPMDELMPLRLIPSRPPTHAKSRCIAITRPLIYGRTFSIIGKNRFPIVLAKLEKFCLNILNWLAGDSIVFAKSPYATFDWSNIASNRNCALVA